MGSTSAARRDPSKAAPPIIETLEGRHLLSAALAGSFTGPVPAALLPGASARLTLRVSNTGDAPAAGPVHVNLYASETPSLDATATLISGATRNLKFRPGATAPFILRANAPASLPDGNYYLIADIQGPAGTSAAAVTPQTVSISAPYVDLAGQITQQPAAVFVSSAGPGVGVARVRVTNLGNAPARGPMQITVYASTGNTIDASGTVIGIASFKSVNIKAGGSRVFAAQLAVPPGTAVGTYALLASINSAHTLPETDPTNNIAVGATPLALLNAPTVPAAPVHHHGNGSGSSGGILYVGGSGYIDPTFYGDPGSTDNSGGVVDVAPAPDNGGSAAAPVDDTAPSPDPGSPPADSTGGGDFGGDPTSDDSGSGEDF